MDHALSENSPVEHVQNEILCMLSTIPIKVSDIAIDLGLPIMRISCCIRTLISEGYPILKGRAKTGQATAWVAAWGWPKVRAAAEAYWDATYQTVVAAA